jgi:hypothetical protein
MMPETAKVFLQATDMSLLRLGTTKRLLEAPKRSL